MARFYPIISVCLFIAAILWGVFVWYPGFQKFGDLKSELAVRSIELQQKQDYFAKIRATAERLKNYQTELAKIDASLPKEIDIPSLFNFIQKTTIENGLVLRDIAAGGGAAPASAEAGTIQDINFNAKVEGTYIAFKSFLSAIYKSARLIEVETITFEYPERTAPSKQKTEVIYSFQVAFKTHFYKTQE